MSNIEHLIENAVTALENNEKYDDWLNAWYTKEQLKQVKSPPEEIWQMAVWCVYTYKPSYTLDLSKQFESAYGYPIPKDE